MNNSNKSHQTRRRFAALTRIAVLATGLAGLSTSLIAVAANAQSYPERPVSLVVPYPAGGAIDSSARRISEFLSDELGQPVVVENKSGANSVVGSTYVSQADPDGYTFLYTTLVAQAGNEADYDDLPYDTIESFEPVTVIQAPPNVLVAHSSVPVETFDELVAYAKENPGELTFGTNGPGSPAHLRGVQVLRSGDLDLRLIPYEGGAAALADLAGGHLDLYPAQLPTILSYVDEGQMKVLAALGDTRLDSMPEVASITETDGYEAFNELATFPLVLAPAGTPENIINQVQTAFAQVLENDDYLEMSRAAREYEPFSLTPEEAGQRMREYIDVIGSLAEE